MITLVNYKHHFRKEKRTESKESIMDNFVYSKRDLMVAGVGMGIIVTMLGLGFGLTKGTTTNAASINTPGFTLNHQINVHTGYPNKIIGPIKGGILNYDPNDRVKKTCTSF